MRSIAFVTSYGEKTTHLCVDQLNRYGFETFLDDRKIPWHEKYKEFILSCLNQDEMQGHFFGKDILRVDADVIVNRDIVEKVSEIPSQGVLMAQFELFDFYRNNVLVGQPVWYSKDSFKIIKKSLDQLDPKRPETWAWRLPEINKYTKSLSGLVGMHGFFQDKETMHRAYRNKVERGQMENYDFELVDKILELKENE